MMPVRDGNRHIHVAGKAQVAAGTAVNAAFDGFQLVDQFHGMDLWARPSAYRRKVAEHVHAGHARAVQDALDIAHDVHHVAVAFHR